MVATHPDSRPSDAFLFDLCAKAFLLDQQAGRSASHIEQTRNNAGFKKVHAAQAHSSPDWWLSAGLFSTTPDEICLSSLSTAFEDPALPVCDVPMSLMGPEALTLGKNRLRPSNSALDMFSIKYRRRSASSSATFSSSESLASLRLSSA